MTSQPQEIGSGKNLAARPLEVEFAVVLSRVIESIEDDPAPLLRNAVYELARMKLRREACRRNPAMNLSEVRRSKLALESAIEGVETMYSKHDELRALQSLDRLIESSEIGRSEVMIEPREPLLIINQAPTQTADTDHRLVFWLARRILRLTSNGCCTGRMPRRCYEEQWSPLLPWRCASYLANSARSDAKPRCLAVSTRNLRRRSSLRLRPTTAHPLRISSIAASLLRGHRRCAGRCASVQRG